MRFLLDMGLAPKSAGYLRGRGHDAIHLREQSLHQLPDPQVLDKAVAEQRVLITFDLDFSRLVAVGHLTWPSVILFRIEKANTAQVNELLDQVISAFPERLEKGCIVVVEPDQIRCRDLPL